MHASKAPIAIWSAIALGCAVLFTAAPAFAYVACNSSGDCWQTGSKVKWPGVVLTFHDDSWWDEHKSDRGHRLHDADIHHNWQRGYWANGEWLGG